MAIVGLLTALAIGGYGSIAKRRIQAVSINNLRQIASAALSYAGENDGALPNRADSVKWPQRLDAYLRDTRVLADPGDSRNWILTNSDPLTDASNETSYIYNGFNDLGTYDDPAAPIRQVRIDQPAQTILFGIPYAGDGNFFMDLVEDNEHHILNLKTFDDGSTYAFADGSARFISEPDYTAGTNGTRDGDRLWLADKSYVPKS